MTTQGWREYVVHSDTEVKGFFGTFRFLSNFHECPVHYDGIIYPSSENAYMAAKTDAKDLRIPLEVCTPKEAKLIGRTIPLRPHWDDVKVEVMRSVVFDKFLRNPQERYNLIQTGIAYLEETNHWGDKFWGVCEGEGLNVLGNILMETREYWRKSAINALRITKLF